MRFLHLAICVCACAGLTAPASALTLRSLDAEPQTVIVTEGEQAQTLTLAPGQPLDGICPKGCIVQLSNGDKYAFDGPERVVIEEGIVFADDIATGSTGN